MEDVNIWPCSGSGLLESMVGGGRMILRNGALRPGVPGSLISANVGLPPFGLSDMEKRGK